MKIEIKKVVIGKFEEVHILHIYPHSTQMNLYRRYAADHWEHLLGKHGWRRYLGPTLLEEAYENWQRNAKRNAKQAKPPTKANK